MSPLDDPVNNRAAGAMPDGRRGIAFEEWKADIARAGDYDQVVKLVRAYLGSWSPEQIAELPMDASAFAIESIDDITARAVLASRAEINAPPEAETRLLRELALTLSAAS